MASRYEHYAHSPYDNIDIVFYDTRMVIYSSQMQILSIVPDATEDDVSFGKFVRFQRNFMIFCLSDLVIFKCYSNLLNFFEFLTQNHSTQ